MSTHMAGGMPDALRADAEQRQEYFNSYIETYLLPSFANNELKRLAKTPKLYFAIQGCARICPCGFPEIR